MTREEIESCIWTIKMLQKLAYNIHGVMDVVDADNCKKIIKALEQEPCEDCISRAEAQTEIMASNKLLSEGDEVLIKVSDAVDVLRNLPSVAPVTVWHRIKTRPLTDEEKEAYGEEYGVEYTFMYDCKMPDGGQEVLVKTQWGIEKTTYHTDYGCYFEDYEDDVIAWMPLPEPYKAESEG